MKREITQISNFEEIKQNIETKDLPQLSSQVKTLITVRDEIAAAKKELKAEYDIYKKELDEYDGLIKEQLDNVRKKALTLAENTYRTTQKIDHKTGEVKTIVETDLPKGYALFKGRANVVYKEDKIPDEYFDKVLNKTKVKKAIDEGKLDFFEVAETVYGEKSIGIMKGSL